MHICALFSDSKFIFVLNVFSGVMLCNKLASKRFMFFHSGGMIYSSGWFPTAGFNEVGFRLFDGGIRRISF